MIDERKGGRSTQAAALGQNDEGITLPSIAPRVPDTPSRIVTLAPTWPPFSPAVLSYCRLRSWAASQGRTPPGPTWYSAASK